ncbi:MAG TPA: S8 family peptidase [Verrucomicrobiae bacterium]|nr:S8 family peptidase [Verrucomicrobiae bacterium]
MKTLLTLGLMVLGFVTARAQTVKLAAPVAAYRSDRILVMPAHGISPGSLEAFQVSLNAQVLQRFPGLGELQVVSVPAGETVSGLIAKFEQSGLVQYAEPDFLRQLDLSPNDQYYTNGTLWGLHNSGQGGGVIDADIDAPEGWDVLSSASNIVVAVLDTGIRRTHEDLLANVWTNQLAGGYGWNALNGTGTPADDEGHGSHVSGILGAVGNNGKGVVGVAWRVQIMAGKCFDAARNGFDSDIIECLEFARTNGARIINMSLSGTAFSSSLSNAVFAARESGIIVVASCGNEAADVDVVPRYPACLDIDNVISVAASTRSDVLWASSNYGATNVDLAAPGHQITSTFAFTDNQYIGPLSGTSAAAPYVAGACALMLAKYPTETHPQIIARVLNAVDPLPSLAGKCVTGGRLNLRKALSPSIQLTSISAPGVLPYQLRVSAGPNRPCVIESSTDLTSWLPIHTNTTSASGTFDYTETASPNSSHRFFRAVSAL